MTEHRENPEPSQPAGGAGAAPSLLTPRRIIPQIIGFIIGAALLGWCISNAVKGGDWSRLGDAHPLLLAGLLGCTIISLLANGTIFWVVIRPVQPLKWTDLQLVNAVTAVLNYAPIRLGLLARIAYHIRVDRLPVVRIGAWLGAIMATMLLGLGSFIVATLLRPQLDLWWILLLLGQIALGGLLLQAMMKQNIIVRYGRGMHLMLAHPEALWGALALRILDIAAFIGRMAFAVAILGLELSMRDTVLLALVTVALTFNPLGRFGYREAGVAIAAGYLGMGGSEFDDVRAQLALIESAGEAAAAIPTGAAALLWYRHKWRKAKRAANPLPGETAG